MALANQEAQRFNHEYIGTEHILLGLVKEGAGVGATVLKNLELDIKKLRLEVEKLHLSSPDMVTMGKLPQSPRAKKVIEYAIEEARSLNHNYVGTEHILLGLLRETEGIAAQALTNLGLKLEDVRQNVLELLGVGLDDSHGKKKRKLRDQPDLNQARMERKSREFWEQPTLELYIDPGSASKEVIREVLEALSDLHIASGGLGLEFQNDGNFVYASERVQA